MPQVFQSEFQKSYSLSFVDLWFPAIISVMFTICVQSAGADLLFPLLYIEKSILLVCILRSQFHPPSAVVLLPD